MQGIEPAAGLVHAFGNEIGRGAEARSTQVAEAFLRIRHGAGIEPNVDEVRFPDHLFTAGRHQENAVDIRPVQVYLIVVVQAHVGRVEALVLQRIGGHYAGGNRLLNFVIQFLYGADANLFFAVFRAPDGQRRAPVAGTGKVPVLDVLQPLPEPSRTGGSGFPGNFLVQLYHGVLYGRCLDEPAVQRVVQHRKICAPAVGIAVHVLLHLESAAVGLHHNAKVYIQRSLFLYMLEVLLVAGLYISAGIFLVRRIYRGGKGRIHVFQTHEAALTVYLRLRIAVFVDGHDGADAGSSGHALIVGTEGGGDVHDARTVAGGYIVAGDNAESISVGLEPGDELMILDAHQLGTLEAAFQHLVGHNLVSFGVAFQRLVFSLGVEPGTQQLLGQHIHGRFPGIRVEGQHADILNIRPHAEGGIGRQGPGRGGPGQEISRESFRAKQRLGSTVLDNFELHGGRGVAHILVAARLVQFVGAEAGAVRGRIRLNGVALIEETLVVNFLEKVPEGFYVAVVVGDVRVFHIYPVTYALRHAFPFLGIFHHLPAAGGVVFFYAHLGADIGLGDAQFLFHAQLYRKTVRIPSGPAAHLVPGLGFVAADGVLDRTGHNVVDARHAVGAGGTFKENEFRSPFTNAERLFEGVDLFPPLQNHIACFRKVQALIFFECHIFCLILHVVFSVQR